MRFSCSSVLGHLKNQKIAEGSDASSFFYWLTSSCLFHNIATLHTHLWRSNKLFLYNLITSAPDSMENHRGYCSTLLARPSNAYSESVDDATPSTCFVFPTSIFTAPNAWTNLYADTVLGYSWPCPTYIFPLRSLSDDANPAASSACLSMGDVLRGACIMSDTFFSKWCHFEDIITLAEDLCWNACIEHGQRYLHICSYNEIYH